MRYFQNLLESVRAGYANAVVVIFLRARAWAYTLRIFTAADTPLRARIHIMLWLTVMPVISGLAGILFWAGNGLSRILVMSASALLSAYYKTPPRSRKRKKRKPISTTRKNLGAYGTLGSKAKRGV